ncbi:hypothetical protein GIB67_024896 [Kingdonia uniflora]|uniref:Uncharacterized protein n=1 Tax=Kingdonia uniflora TaxID=39325 RepID=A0A7J7NZB0_9MAGN|nr:hypothetical protein GIB67_024896 [Kingdonia uniflora]
MASWVRTITTPFRKARTFLNQTQPREKKTQQEIDEEYHRAMVLQGEVMACAYQDVQVMWSMLDKSKPEICSS